MDLADLLVQAAERGSRREDSGPSSPPDVLCITLREVASRYVAPCPFKPGDLVSPRPGSNSKGVGKPFVVLEALDDPVRNFNPVDDMHDTSSNLFGRRIDLRVAGEMQGNIVSFWGESWEYEPYTGPGADTH